MLNEEYKLWTKTDKALMSLLLATVNEDDMDYILGCKTSLQAWIILKERFATISRSRINVLKSELYTIQKELTI